MRVLILCLMLNGCATADDYMCNQTCEEDGWYFVEVKDGVCRCSNKPIDSKLKELDGTFKL